MIESALADGLIARAARPDYPRFEAQLRSSGYCARPVRLRGRIETCDADGRRRVWSTDTEPDGILQEGVREAARSGLPAVRGALPRRRLPAHRRRPARWQGVPDTVTEHPALFVTLTAPSFGIVHTRPVGRTVGRDAAGHDATRPSASTAYACPAAAYTPRTTRASASRSASSASTTPAR
jgi:hypothetical protein